MRLQILSIESLKLGAGLFPLKGKKYFRQDFRRENPL
jgi:hypothetical protein